MISGLDWVFSLFETAIILEDDCLPDQSFFPFCEELLEKYRGDNRIAYIAGANLVEDHLRTEYSYFFSRIGGIWGWATWRLQWRRYDRNLSDWPKFKAEHLLAEIFDQPEAVEFWTGIFDAMYEKRGPNTWDYQWLYTCLRDSLLTAVSSVNLIANIGFRPDATHTTETDARFMLTANRIEFPLRHPFSVVPLRSMDTRRVQDMISSPFIHRISRTSRRIASRLFR